MYSFMNGEEHPKVTHFRWLMCCSVFPNWFVNTANIKKSGKSLFFSFRKHPLNLFCTWGHCIHSLFLVSFLVPSPRVVHKKKFSLFQFWPSLLWTIWKNIHTHKKSAQNVEKKVFLSAIEVYSTIVEL